MRFRRLAIPAYGPFTDLALEFPKGVEENAADFHLIYGRNEAGKSSLLRAIRDLLYGIHAQTADNFIHDYKDLRISAEIENRAGQRLAVQRRKGNRNTLLDADGNALDEAALTPYLGPVDREFFTTMFGLGSDELRQGAHDLLQGKGDLGQALFSASLAGTPIHHVLEVLDGEARTLFNGRARVGVSLRPAVDAYEEALRASKQAQVKAETWEDTLRELDAALHGKSELDAGLHSLRARQDWLRRCLDALPTLGRLRDTLVLLNDLPALPVLPAGFAEAAEATQKYLAQAEQTLSDLRQRIGDLVARRDSLAPRAEVLACAAEIDALAHGLAVYRQGRDALSADKAEVEQREAGLRTGLLGLGQSAEPGNIADLRIPLAEELTLREAADALVEAERAGAEQRREAERLTAEQEKTRARLGLLPRSEAVALRAAQTASAPAATGALVLADKVAALENLSRRLASQQQLLPGAPADAAAIYALALPASARLREYEAAATDLAGRARQVDETMGKTAKSLRDLKAKLERLEQRGALPSHDALAQARAHRDDGWRRVLTCWLEGAPEQGWDGTPLAESYPAAVLQADALADRLREEADAVAQAEELRWQIRDGEATRQEQQAEQQRLDQARQTWRNDWNALWQATGLAASSPAEMLEWREQWLEFRSRHEAWRELRDEVEAIRQDIIAAEALLRPPLDGADGGLLELRELAERRLRAADQVLGERRALEARLAELVGEDDALARQRVVLDAALAQAQTRWRGNRHGGELRPETALRLLEARLELVTQYDAWTRLSAALAEKKNTLAAYARQAETLAAALTVPPFFKGGAGGISETATQANIAKSPPAPLWERGEPPPTNSAGAEVQVNALSEALAQARALQIRRNQTEEDLEQLTASLSRAEQGAETARRDLAALLAQAGVADLAALQTLLADLAIRQRLISDQDNLRAALHVQARGEDLDNFIERVRGEDGESLATELEDLADQIRELEARREQAIQNLARATDAKALLEASGADAAEHLQSAHHAAARIRQDATRYLRLRLATRFLQTQIETFRERNQGPLLAKAGELFRRMTGASFSGLGADYAEDDTATLVGQKNGVNVPVAGMSEGTRDQLYLALRFAAIELHQLNHEPMPLILDDLLITFDDDRTRAILPLLRKLAGTTQVLLFTHHQHLLDLARETLPAEAVCLHELKGSFA
ncbi:MAG: AAA family ATPase [Gallionellaceae bacterium]|nr:AAA family ATPase [Gallionellaceae bacterium]